MRAWCVPLTITSGPRLQVPRQAPASRLKRQFASVSPAYEAVGSQLAVEWTVEGHRGRVDAVVVPLPFLDLPRKRA